MRYTTAIGLFVILAVSPGVMADTIIDTFDDFDPGLWPLVNDSTNGTPPTTVTNSQSGLPVSGVVGGVRNGSLTYMGGPLGVSAAIIPGVFSYSSDALTDGSAGLSYPGVGGLNLDLTYAGDPSDPSFGAAFIIDVVSSDLLTGTPIRVTLTDGSGTSRPGFGTAFGPGTVSIPLSVFAGVDFSAIDQIDVLFDPAQEFDITVDFIGFDWPDAPPTTPEPASILIWSLVGVVGVVASRRFRARKH